jgi:hypothetical protein
VALVVQHGRLVAERLVAPARAAHLVDRAVAREAVQPRPQVVRACARANRGVRADEDVLDDVLGVVLGAAQERAGVADERLAVAVVECRERGAVARRDTAGELGVVGTGALEDRGHGRGIDASAAPAVGRRCACG